MIIMMIIIIVIIIIIIIIMIVILKVSKTITGLSFCRMVTLILSALDQQ